MNNAAHLTADANTQAARDQGISDACNGYPPAAWLVGDAIYVAEPDSGFGSYRVFTADQLGREAFAYARAYEANR